MITLLNDLTIQDKEVEITAIRAQGAGGQNVNKVSTAIHLRFDIRASTLPENYKTKLLQFSDQRITQDGVIIIKAQQFRTREKNKEEALKRFRELIRIGVAEKKARRPTKSTRGSQLRRMDSKTQRGKTKALRGKVDF